jgi:hypothetical protein
VRKVHQKEESDLKSDHKQKREGKVREAVTLCDSTATHPVETRWVDRESDQDAANRSR